MKEKGIIIIGNGIAGITAARTIRKLHPQIRIRIISSESRYFFSRTALMYIYMGHMRLQDTQPYEPSFYQKNRLELIYDNASQIDIQNKKVLLSQSPQPLDYDMLLLATGASPNFFGWKGQNLQGVQGLYSLQDLEKLEKESSRKIRRAVIVGGGLIGIELAEMLHTRKIPVVFLVRESAYWEEILPPEESAMIQKEIKDHHIDLRLSTELKEIRGDENHHVSSIVTSQGEEIPCSLVGLTAGVHPNIKLIEETSIESGQGILINRQMETSIPDIFAAGDCAEFHESEEGCPTVEQLWYTGKNQGIAAGRFIARRAFQKEGKLEQTEKMDSTPYQRGIWFNSAKFFTIEYQTYGKVPSHLDPERTHLWSDPKSKILIRLVWEGKDPKSPITGFNFLGTRFRHNVCKQWIQEKKSASYVVAHLHQACFDPEFYRHSFRSFQKSFLGNELSHHGNERAKAG